MSALETSISAFIAAARKEGLRASLLHKIEGLDHDSLVIRGIGSQKNAGGPITDYINGPEVLNGHAYGKVTFGIPSALTGLYKAAGMRTTVLQEAYISYIDKARPFADSLGEIQDPITEYDVFQTPQRVNMELVVA